MLCGDCLGLGCPNLLEALIGDVDSFGVAILEVTPEQRHAAIVFREQRAAGLSVLHLAWHYVLRVDPHTSKYRCVPCKYFDPEELDFFAEHAARIFDANKENGIPYGFGYTGGGVFNGDLSFIDKPGAGLTCATFLLAFFNNLGFEILDIQSWQNRPDDEQWQRNIFDHLRSHLDEVSAPTVECLIGQAYRYRPEEVVGAIGSYQDSPLSFTQAVSIGQQLLAEMRGQPAARSH